MFSASIWPIKINNFVSNADDMQSGVIALKEFKYWTYISLMDLTYNKRYMFKH